MTKPITSFYQLPYEFGDQNPKMKKIFQKVTNIITFTKNSILNEVYSRNKFYKDSMGL